MNEIILKDSTTSLVILKTNPNQVIKEERNPIDPEKRNLLIIEREESPGNITRITSSEITKSKKKNSKPFKDDNRIPVINKI